MDRMCVRSSEASKRSCKNFEQTGLHVAAKLVDREPAERTS